MCTRSLVPPTAADLADLLRDASDQGRPVVPWGAGTLQHLGNAPPPGALTLQTTALDRVVEHNPADLTITVEAGAALGAIQETLRPHGQWLPWHPPSAAATVGGLLAAGVSGPLRLGYGTSRDWVLGMRVALGDGRLVKSGGKVVKNVAGYDAHKLHIGALGTLGVIVEVTFKVAPLPERVGALLIACRTREDGVMLAERLRARPLAPVSLALLEGWHPAGAPGAEHASDTQGPTLAVRFAGVGPAVERQLGVAVAAAAAAGATTVDRDGERSHAIWADIAGFAAPPTGTTSSACLILRTGAPPARLHGLLSALGQHAPGGSSAQILGYAGVGLAYARWTFPEAPDALPISEAVVALRRALIGEGGYAVIEDAPAPLRTRLDLWGAPPATLPLMRALKAQWDPRGVLNRGRYLGGL